MSGREVNSVLQVRWSAAVPGDWDDLVRSDSGADFFHTMEWTIAAGTHFPHLEPVWLSVWEADRLLRQARERLERIARSPRSSR